LTSARSGAFNPWRPETEPVDPMLLLWAEEVTRAPFATLK